MNRLTPASSLLCGLLLFVLPDMARAAPAGVEARPKANVVDVFDFWEVCLQVAHPDAPNPFTDVEVSGEVTPPGGSAIRVEGFCDAADGSLFGLRFMPSQAGEHSFTITFRQGNFCAKQSGRFLAQPSRRAGPVRVDREHPFHFVREGTGQHWFWNCRERDIVVSLIFYVDGADRGVDPFGKSRMGGPDEQRYYRYTVARFAAYANLMWDVANEYRLFRDDAWAEKMGALVKECDPYDHLTSTHGHGDFRFRQSPWADFAMYQSWDEHGGYAFMLKNRRDQAATGRPMPQINEEYGYEDHYPLPWGEKRLWPARTADTRRRLAWEMTMAGCYQTTGERANDGTGAGPDTGGGWVNGRGNEHMTMLLGYRHLMNFFTGLPWWTLEPRDDLAGADTLLLAEPGKRYIAYLPRSGVAEFTLAAGTYRAKWYNPRIGVWHELPAVSQASDGRWQSAPAPDAGDWALLLELP